MKLIITIPFPFSIFTSDTFSFIFFSQSFKLSLSSQPSLFNHLNGYRFIFLHLYLHRLDFPSFHNSMHIYFFHPFTVFWRSHNFSFSVLYIIIASVVDFSFSLHGLCVHRLHAFISQYLGSPGNDFHIRYKYTAPLSSFHRGLGYCSFLFSAVFGWPSSNVLWSSCVPLNLALLALS